MSNDPGAAQLLQLLCAGTAAEALACRSIAERGVQLVATAHGQLLENLIKVALPPLTLLHHLWHLELHRVARVWQGEGDKETDGRERERERLHSNLLSANVCVGHNCHHADHLVLCQVVLDAGYNRLKISATLLQNPTLSDLIGGICSVTLGASTSFVQSSIPLGFFCLFICTLAFGLACFIFLNYRKFVFVNLQAGMYAC